MNKFKSFLSPQLQQYLIYRQTLGYSMKPSLSHLKTFDRYLKQRQAEQVLLQPSFFVQMQADIKIDQRITPYFVRNPVVCADRLGESLERALNTLVG